MYVKYSTMNHHHQLVFVYGTLKRGLFNAGKMTNRDNGWSAFVCAAKTVKKYPLVVTTKWNIPFLLDKPGHGHQIIGEVFKVDDKMLLFLEKMERLYRKDTLAVQPLESNDPEANSVEGVETKELQCIGFLLDNYKDKLLDVTFDEAYDPKGNPRHEFNIDKVGLTPETRKEIKQYLEGEVLKDWEKQVAKDEYLKAKTL